MIVTGWSTLWDTAANVDQTDKKGMKIYGTVGYEELTGKPWCG